MTLAPVLPVGGLAGWRFLDRTLESQKATLARDPVQLREVAAFRERIGSIQTAEALVNDREVLKVALGAFGLEDDLPNRFFIRKVLEGGTLAPDSLANRLADPRYRAMAETFGFGDFGARTARQGFADTIVEAYRGRSFERAVGEVDPSMRLALSLERELGDIVARNENADARWFNVMGSPPIREVFETALGLPSGFGTLDIDRQLEVFRERSGAVFGASEVADFSRPETLNDLRQRFLLLAENTGPVGPVAPALALLQPSGGAAGVLAALYGS